jgi:hypothetical protein
VSRNVVTEVRMTEQERRVYEDAAGPRRLSAWIREACRLRLASESATPEPVAEKAPAQAASRAPAPRRPSSKPANHHVRCSCPRCAEAA